MKEYQLYTAKEFSLLLLCGCIAILGVWVVVKKPLPKLELDEMDKQDIMASPIEFSIVKQLKSFGL